MPTPVSTMAPPARRRAAVGVRAGAGAGNEAELVCVGAVGNGAGPLGDGETGAGSSPNPASHMGRGGCSGSNGTARTIAGGGLERKFLRRRGSSRLPSALQSVRSFCATRNPGAVPGFHRARAPSAPDRQRPGGNVQHSSRLPSGPGSLCTTQRARTCRRRVGPGFHRDRAPSARERRVLNARVTRGPGFRRARAPSAQRST